jgi:hypothetical protein
MKMMEMIETSIPSEVCPVEKLQIATMKSLLTLMKQLTMKIFLMLFVVKLEDCRSPRSRPMTTMMVQNIRHPPPDPR